MNRRRSPQYVLAHLPHDLQRRLRHEWWRRNHRSLTFWVGVLALCVSPLPGAWLATRLGVPIPLADRPLRDRNTWILIASISCTFLPGFVLFLLTAGRTAAQNLAAILGAHHLCLSCGYDLRATPGRCPECGQLAGTKGKT